MIPSALLQRLQERELYKYLAKQIRLAAKSPEAPETVAKLLRPEIGKMFKPGGIGIGLPFMEPAKTIAPGFSLLGAKVPGKVAELAGKVAGPRAAAVAKDLPLVLGPQRALFSAAQETGIGKRAVKEATKVLRKFYPKLGMHPMGANLVDQFRDAEVTGNRKAAEFRLGAYGGASPKVLRDLLGATVGSTPTSIPKEVYLEGLNKAVGAGQFPAFFRGHRQYVPELQALSKRATPEQVRAALMQYAPDSDAITNMDAFRAKYAGQPEVLGLPDIRKAKMAEIWTDEAVAGLGPSEVNPDVTKWGTYTFRKEDPLFTRLKGRAPRRPGDQLRTGQAHAGLGERPPMEDIIAAGAVPDWNIASIDEARIQKSYRKIAAAQFRRQAELHVGMLKAAEPVVKGKRNQAAEIFQRQLYATPLAKSSRGHQLQLRRLTYLGKDIKVLTGIEGENLVATVTRGEEELGKATAKTSPGAAVVESLVFSGKDIPGWKIPDARVKSALLAALENKAIEKGLKYDVADHIRYTRLGKLEKPNEYVDKVLRAWAAGTGKEGKGAMGALSERGWFGSVLEGYNRNLFKPLVTSGVGPIPNPAFHSRNIVWGFVQNLMNSDISPKNAFRPAGAMIDSLAAQVAKKVGIKYRPGIVSQIQRGVPEKGLMIGPYTGEEVARWAKDVMGQGMAGTELIDTAATTLGKDAAKLGKKGHEWLHFAANLTNWIEDNLRVSHFVSALESGVDPKLARQMAAEFMLDYRYVSDAERAVRDWFPFAKFQIEQTPKTLRAIAERPAILQPVKGFVTASRGREAALPEWMTGMPAVPLGSGQGENQPVVGSFGLFEDLAKLDTGRGIGRTIEQGILGSLSPLPKAAYTAITKREPYFGKIVEGMDTMPQSLNLLPESAQRMLGMVEKKLPGGESWKEIPGGLNVLLQAQPLSRQLRTLDKLLDQRAPLIERIINVVTGVKVYRVDKDRELKRRIRDYLAVKAQKGELGTIQQFFATGDTDPELTALIKDYYKMHRRSKKASPAPQAAVPAVPHW
jgi:hypothetical protein